ncbi:hypothetical protein MRB53_026651 [Persea americana]|uniref:Uncharacterized protein n=1 Tax=Persea americana TaxID=3435 RepID=A0ACC2LIM8_PERAE|nr:hypothetical protein MRB53_026651 [Persea americana]
MAEIELGKWKVLGGRRSLKGKTKEGGNDGLGIKPTARSRQWELPQQDSHSFFISNKLLKKPISHYNLGA